ncbi:MAG: hypothetical protein KGL90_02780 [Burkholderiales bacterium]|nr:hypothetical protein [Burkholderiales bacterium]
MTTLKIDLDDLIMALSARYELDDPSHYMDALTGRVIYAGEGHEDLPADLSTNPRYRWIEAVEGEEAVGIMERFAAQLPDVDSAARLHKALSEDEPMEAFMECLLSLSFARDAWFVFQHAAYTQLAQDWCKAQGIQPEWI